MKVVKSEPSFSKAEEYAKHGYEPKLRTARRLIFGVTGNGTELEFAQRALEKRGRVLRHGWPDFLVELADKTVAVEVKQGRDRVRRNQAIMFEALERLGLHVYVWNPDRPDRLVPWRKYRPVRRLR